MESAPGPVTEDAVRRYLLFLDDPLSTAGRPGDPVDAGRARRGPSDPACRALVLERASSIDEAPLRQAFVEHAKAWADAEQVSVTPCPAARRRSARGRVRRPRHRPSSSNRSTPVTAGGGRAGSLAAAHTIQQFVLQQQGTFVLAGHLNGAGGSPATVRKAVEELVDTGQVERLSGLVADHGGRGRADPVPPTLTPRARRCREQTGRAGLTDGRPATAGCRRAPTLRARRSPPGPRDRLREMPNVSDASSRSPTQPLTHLDRSRSARGAARTCPLQILDVDTAAVLLLDEAAGELVATAARGSRRRCAQVRVPVGDGFAGPIAARSSPSSSTTSTPGRGNPMSLGNWVASSRSWARRWSRAAVIGVLMWAPSTPAGSARTRWSSSRWPPTAGPGDPGPTIGHRAGGLTAASSAASSRTG